MKHIIYTFIVIFTFFTFVGCENTDYPKYDVSQKDGVYLPYNDSTCNVSYNFGFDSKTEHIYRVKINLMGMPENVDRRIKLNIISDKYTGKDTIAAKAEYFELPDEFVFPKDSVTATIPVKLLRHKDLEETISVLAFELVETEDLLVRGHSKFIITFDDKIPPTPAWWATYKWGEFTKFKGQLFFKYFWEMEGKNKYLYDKIVARWGYNLDIPPLIYQNNPTVAYPFAFGMYVELPMWEYSEAHPELNLNIQKPVIY